MMLMQLKTEKAELQTENVELQTESAKLQTKYDELEVALEKQIADNKGLEEEKAAKTQRVQTFMDEAFEDCKQQAERANDATLQVSSEKMLSQELRKRYEVAVATLLIASNVLITVSFIIFHFYTHI